MGQFTVAVRLDTASDYSRRILVGIGEYRVTASDWTFAYMPWHESRDDSQVDPFGCGADGVISDFLDNDVLQRASEHNNPVVITSERRRTPGIYQVVADSDHVGRLAAEHLISKGLRHFAYWGFHGHLYSQRRELGFRVALDEAGFDCTVYNVEDRVGPDFTWHQEMDDTRQWLQELPRPLGILTCNDVRGNRILQLCRDVGLQAPSDVAVLGVDNASIICYCTEPTLSSVDIQPERIGYEAAATLDRLMRGGDAADVRRIPPYRVIERESTRVIAASHPAVRDALRYIAEHASEGLTVESLLKNIPLSRRALERAFRAEVGRTPLQEIRRVQLDIARRLLAESDLPMTAVADRAGFREARYLSRVFRSELDMTPTDYRKTHRTVTRRDVDPAGNR